MPALRGRPMPHANPHDRQDKNTGLRRHQNLMATADRITSQYH